MRRINTFRVLLTVLLLAGLLGTAVWRQGQRAQPPAAGETPAPAATATPVSEYVGKLVITELMEKNKSVMPDEDGDFSDWIEMYNASGEELDLTGWRIADGPEDRGWLFPETRLPAGEHLLVFASKKDRTSPFLHTSFGLSEGECVCIWDRDGLPVDSLETGGCRGDVSMARLSDGSAAPSLYPTPGYDNSREGYEQFQQTLRAEGPLVINEVVVANFSLYYFGYRDDCDWVEIKNISLEPVNLGGYYLSDQEDDRLLCRLPDTELAAGGLMLLACDRDPEGLFGAYHVDFALDSSEEQIYLSAADGSLVDRASLRSIPYNGSYGRRDGEPGFFFFDRQSPGRDNTGGARFIAAAPVSLTRDGMYEDADPVAVELQAEGEIRYTLDGSLPTAESTLYTGPVTMEKTGVLRAVSIEPDCLVSPALTLNFFLHEGHSLPVVSLVGDNPRDLGLMVSGGHKGYEMPGVFSFYRDGEGFSINCGVSMNGETSLAEWKKNMSLRFRGAYGQETLEYDLFGGGVTHFTNLLLRAGQDQHQAVIRNELAQELCARADCNVINQRSLFCVLYLNGEYVGLYTVKEKANEQLYADLAGVSRGSVQLYEAPAPYDSDFYNDVIAFPYYNDMTLPENYARFCECVDIDSLIDWTFLEGFCANTDVTMGNVRYVRSSEADGKWRFLFYDLDAAFRFPGSMYYNLMSGFSIQNIQISGAIVPLMKNAEFRDRFLRRAADLMSGPLSNEAVLQEIDRLAGEIAPEVKRDRARIGWDEKSWEKSLRNLKELVKDENWRQMNIDALCDVFELEQEERAFYFGGIDGK